MMVLSMSKNAEIGYGLELVVNIVLVECKLNFSKI